MRLTPGSHVTPAVMLVEELEQGGMGSIWLARHHELGADVAVKIVRPSHAFDDRYRERLAREARMAAAVDNRHVIRIFDSGRLPDGTPFLVMQLLRGESLAARLARCGTLSLSQVVAIVEQAACGLAATHQHGLVHRDITTSNLFLANEDGIEDTTVELFVKILDFGIARDQRDREAGLTDDGAVVGTPAYMSPEQMADSQNVDCRADLWSLAVVAYEALTGQLPFPGRTVGAVCMAVANGRYPRASSLYSVSPEVDVFFARAFCTDLSRRFRSAQELARALRVALETDATPQKTAEHAPPEIHIRGEEFRPARRWIGLALASVPFVAVLGWQAITNAAQHLTSSRHEVEPSRAAALLSPQPHRGGVRRTVEPSRAERPASTQEPSRAELPASTERQGRLGKPRGSSFASSIEETSPVRRATPAAQGPSASAPAIDPYKRRLGATRDHGF